MNRFTLISSLSLICLAAAPSFAQKKTPVGTVGSAQMAGGVGLFGTTYTVANSGGYMYNVTIKSAEYSIDRFNQGPDSAIVPKADEKLLILHLSIQNPKKEDAYIGHSAIDFSTVGLDDITRNGCSDLRRASAKAPLADALKPGQKFPEDILVALTVPAVGPVPKLILNMGRFGTKDEVIRFFLGKGPNVVKPLPAAYADPTDKTGATALAAAPAKVGASYAVGHNDFAVTSIAYVPGPIGEAAAGDGNQFLVDPECHEQAVGQPLHERLPQCQIDHRRR